MGRALLFGAMLSAGALFLLSLPVSLWVAYDRWLALPRFGLLVGGVLFSSTGAWLSAAAREQKRAALATGSSFLAGAIGLCFLLTHDWRLAAPGDFQPFVAMTGWMQQLQSPLESVAWLKSFSFHENAVAGALIILLPIGGASCREQWRHRRFTTCVSEGLVLALGAFALILTFSRGAWLGLGIGFVITYMAVHARRWVGTAWAFLCGALVLGTALSTFLVTPALLRLLLTVLTGFRLGGTAASRLTLWQDAVTLVPDYWFTGSGLQSTAMVLSSYVYLLHVPYLAHGHNFYLQLALEQGAPALLAFGIITVGVLWHSRRQVATNPIVFGATVGLLAVLVHGWFDAELYSSVLAPLLFLPLGLLVHTTQAQAPPVQSRRETVSATLLGLAIPVMTILLFASSVGVPTLAMVNWATVIQTRTELVHYHWPAWPLQDAVRQRLPAEFAAITARYRAVLAQEPANVTAERRLGQILLSQNDYRGAQQHLERAYWLAPNQRATRQLLGEVYALAGKEVAAWHLWRGLDLNQGQLWLRIQWYAKEGKVSDSLQLAKVVDKMAKTVGY